MNKSILIIYDESNKPSFEESILAKEHYNVIKTNNGNQVIKEIETYKPNLILIDLMLPDINGLKLCKKIKDSSETEDIPVIILSPKSDEQDILIGFSFGCSDYITKPVNEKILLARIKAALNKTCRYCKYCVKNRTASLKFDQLLIDPLSFEVSISNKLINLTPLEFKLIYYLAKNNNKVFTREQLYIELYEDKDSDRSDRSIDILINRIRKKIRSYGKNIESIYGIGYTFKIQKSL